MATHPYRYQSLFCCNRKVRAAACIQVQLHDCVRLAVRRDLFTEKEWLALAMSVQVVVVVGTIWICQPPVNGLVESRAGCGQVPRVVRRSVHLV